MDEPGSATPKTHCQHPASPSALHRPRCLHGPRIFKALGFLPHHAWLLSMLGLLYRPDCFQSLPWHGEESALGLARLTQSPEMTATFVSGHLCLWPPFFPTTAWALTHCLDRRNTTSKMELSTHTRTCHTPVPFRQGSGLAQQRRATGKSVHFWYRCSLEKLGNELGWGWGILTAERVADLSPDLWP